MKIYPDKIPQEGIKIEAKEPSKILEVKDVWAEFNEPINVSVFVYKTGDTLLVNGSLKTKVDLKCGRCLKKFNQALETNEFSYSRNIAGLDEVDITEEIREEILLLVPIKPLCIKNCKGLCPKCGQLLNEKKCSCKITKEDIRWAGLDKLRLRNNIN